MLALMSSQRLLSYLTGCVTSCGGCALHDCVNPPGVSNIQSLAAFIRSDYQRKQWQTTLMMWASGSIAFAVNTISRKALAWFVGLMSLLRVLVFLCRDNHPDHA